MKPTKEEICGFAASLTLCFLLLLLLYFTVLRTVKSTGEEGIFVNFGTVDRSSGSFEPRPQGENRVIPQEETAPPAETLPTPTLTPPALTQEQEETAAIEAAKKEQERIRRAQEEAERVRQAEEKRKKAEEEQRKRDAINQQVSGAFGTGTSTRSQEGTAQSGSGNQGSSEGNAPIGSYQGTGGSGSFDLKGRSLGPGGLPKPAYSVQEEGRIVINITVDRSGSVIFAEIGKGTNISNESMRKSALEAARKAKFNAVTATENQSGTVTYNYKLN